VPRTFEAAARRLVRWTGRTPWATMEARARRARRGLRSRPRIERAEALCQGKGRRAKPGRADPDRCSRPGKARPASANRPAGETHRTAALTEARPAAADARSYRSAGPLRHVEAIQPMSPCARAIRPRYQARSSGAPSHRPPATYSLHSSKSAPRSRGACRSPRRGASPPRRRGRAGQGARARQAHRLGAELGRVGQSGASHRGLLPGGRTAPSDRRRRPPRSRASPHMEVSSTVLGDARVLHHAQAPRPLTPPARRVAGARGIFVHGPVGFSFRKLPTRSREAT